MADFFDIDAAFELNAIGDINIVTDLDAIRQSIRSILLTVAGFKPGVGYINEKMGINVMSYQFAPMTLFAAQSLSDNINRQLTIFEPRISIRNVNVNANLKENSFEVDITYSVEGSRQPITFRTIINQI